MLQTYLQPPTKNGCHYHCHFALRDLLNGLIKPNFLEDTNYFYANRYIMIKISTTFSLKLPIPITEKVIKELSSSIHRFTDRKELMLCKTLVENTDLNKLKISHCLSCSKLSTCRAFSEHSQI